MSLVMKYFIMARFSETLKLIDLQILIYFNYVQQTEIHTNQPTENPQKSPKP